VQLDIRFNYIDLKSGTFCEMRGRVQEMHVHSHFCVLYVLCVLQPLTVKTQCKSGVRRTYRPI